MKSKNMKWNWLYCDSGSLLVAGAFFMVLVFLFPWGSSLSASHSSGGTGYGVVTIQTDDVASTKEHLERLAIYIWDKTPYAKTEASKLKANCKQWFVDNYQMEGDVILLGVGKAAGLPTLNFCLSKAPPTEKLGQVLCNREGKDLIFIDPEARKIVCAPVKSEAPSV